MSDDDDLVLWYRPRQYARLVGVSVRTVRRWIREGHLEAVKVDNGFSWRVRKKKTCQQVPTRTNMT